jgi:hypothetical protein
MRTKTVSPAISLGLVLLAAALPERATEMEKVEYRGWKNNLKLSNGDIELIVTLDVGPRVISYRLANGKNVFKEYDDQMGKAGEADWMIRGGHRLWVAPEDPTRTYFPDNAPVSYQQIRPGVVRFVPRAETIYGLQKEMEIHVPPQSHEVTVVHRVTNIGQKPTDMAIWALSVMAPGGIELIPLPPKGKHPGAAANAKSPADFAPNQLLVLWPFTDLKDPRLNLGTDFITLKQDTSAKGPTKLGLLHKLNSVGYLNGNTLFVKHFPVVSGAIYTDGGVNYETFTNEDMLEMESLGPLYRVDPARVVEHTERWELFTVKDRAEAETKLKAR